MAQMVVIADKNRVLSSLRRLAYQRVSFQAVETGIMDSGWLF